MSRHSFFHKQSGNATVIALVALVVVAGAAFAWFSMNGTNPLSAGQVPGVQTASAETSSSNGPAAIASAAGDEAAKDDPAANIKPGNPVVAKVDGKDINRADVVNFLQTLPPQTRQMPLQNLFPLAVDQLVNNEIIVAKTKNVKLDDDPEVQKQLAQAKEQIVRSVYLQKEVEKKLTPDSVKQAYDKMVKEFPDIEEVKARHILVKDEAKAKDLIQKLDAGEDFAKLAAENSTDGTAKNGGEVGYFAKNEVVPAFADAAFATPVGSYTKAPVKTDFGYHIIRTEEKRKRPAPAFEAAKPAIEGQLRREILSTMLKDWRNQSKVEVFDINGDKVEPSSGGE